MIEFLNNNPTLFVSLIVFIFFVIIGFLGDMYLRKRNKIGSLISSDNKSDNSRQKEFTESETKNNSAPISDVDNNQTNNLQENVYQTPEDAMVDILNNAMPANGTEVNQIQNIDETPVVETEVYPPENTVQNDIRQPEVFDGNIENDDKVDNMF